MRPIFPSKTFPNHYTLVTGLYAESHGLVGNSMYDPDTDEYYFTMGPPEPDQAKWWAGEPLWTTVQKAGLSAACVFWPGSDVAIGGVLPDRYLQWDSSLSYEGRVAALIQYFNEDKPSFATIYFDGVDHNGHIHGPFAPGVQAALSQVDATIGGLVRSLDEIGMLSTTDIIITSDHGMVQTSYLHISTCCCSSDD